MLYESEYNQYFLEHSWGPWKKHLYISRDEKDGHFVYKYPPEYYNKYRGWKQTRAEAAVDDMKKGWGSTSKNVANANYDRSRSADQNVQYYNEYYNTGVDKFINRSVKAAVKALNFGLDMKEKAEGYLTRFGNAVAGAWNNAKTKVTSNATFQAGKNFVSNMANQVKSNVTVQRVASSIQNLIKGAGEAVSKGWNAAKTGARNAAKSVSDTVTNTVNKLRKNNGGSRNYANARAV